MRMGGVEVCNPLCTGPHGQIGMRNPTVADAVVESMSSHEEPVEECLGELKREQRLDSEGVWWGPSWPDLRAGSRPEMHAEGEPGEWQHGWQYWSSSISDSYFRKGTMLSSCSCLTGAPSVTIVYPELSGDGGRARLVLVAEGGRWSSETAGFLSAFQDTCPSSCSAGPKLLGSDVGVPCWRAVQQGRSPCPSSNSGLRWGQVQFHLCKRCCVRTGLRERAVFRVV